MPDQLEDHVYERLLHYLVGVAQHHLAVSEDPEALEDLFDERDVVFGVWPDESLLHGAGFSIIKGEMLLRKVSRNQQAMPERMTAIPCASLEHAQALKQVFGGLDRLDA